MCNFEQARILKERREETGDDLSHLLKSKSYFRFLQKVGFSQSLYLKWGEHADKKIFLLAANWLPM